jgi:hypothetical protein
VSALWWNLHLITFCEKIISAFMCTSSPTFRSPSSCLEVPWSSAKCAQAFSAPKSRTRLPRQARAMFFFLYRLIIKPLSDPAIHHDHDRQYQSLYSTISVSLSLRTPYSLTTLIRPNDLSKCIPPTIQIAKMAKESLRT